MSLPIPDIIAPPHSIIDTHAHLNDSRFDILRDDLLANLEDMGVYKVINCGCDFKTIDECCELSRRYDFCYTAAGWHPENIPETEIDFNRLDEIIKSDKKIVAVGETGLDYHFRSDNKELQKKAFHAQLEIAESNSLPVIIHDRDAHGDTLEILKEHKPCGVVHCFSGSVEMAKEVLNLGMYIGIGGVLTFKNTQKLKEVAAYAPLDHILLETDAPYMSPEPFRGRTNHSGLIIYVAQKLSEIKNIPIAEVLNTTAQNAEKLFKI